MPIDPNMLNPMFDPFRNMLKDVESQNLTGPDVDKLHELINRMEQLGQEHSDINAFNGALMQENLYGQFSDYYGKALASKAKAEGDAKGYDDTTLLKQSIDALKNAITEINRGYEEAIKTAKGKKADDKKVLGKKMKGLKSSDNSIEVAILQNPELIIKGIQDVIDLGEQPGMTLPKFLRLQMEKGLDKAMEGSVVARNGQEYLLEATKSNPVSPYHIEVDTKKLNAFDELAAKSKFNLPNTKELSYVHRDIDYEYAGKIAIWREITYRWDDLLSSLAFWSLSYCSFAPSILPWKVTKDPVAATIKSQKTIPGIFKQKERLFKKYFGLDFMDIFKHDTFKWAVKYDFISESQEFVEFLIEKVYPHCKPFNDLPSDVIEQRALFYNGTNDQNPTAHKVQERYKEFYDNKFGTGRYLEKFGEIEKSTSTAAPWNLDNFKYAH